MNDDSKRRIFMVGALVFAGGALAAISAGNMGDNLVYYWDVSELVRNSDKAVGATIRLGGLVEEDTVEWDNATSSLSFRMTDGSEEVVVRATGAPPQMFREGIGVVVEGTLTDAGTFESDRLMVKHSNEYKEADADMTPEERKKLYDSVLDGSAQGGSK